MTKYRCEILLYLPLSGSDMKKIRGIGVMYQPSNSFNATYFVSGRFSSRKDAIVC